GGAVNSARSCVSGPLVPARTTCPAASFEPSASPTPASAVVLRKSLRSNSLICFSGEPRRRSGRGCDEERRCVAVHRKPVRVRGAPCTREALRVTIPHERPYTAAETCTEPGCGRRTERERRLHEKSRFRYLIAEHFL